MNLKIFLFIILMTTMMFTGCQPGGIAGTSPSDCYRVEFLDVSETSEVASVWRYRVEELACAQDLSNWLLELPACAIIVEASPPPWESIQSDPQYKMNGIKWQTGTDFQSGEFRVALSGDLATGMTRAGVKGPDISIVNVAGPVCRGTTPTASTGTVTLAVTPILSTATLESTSLPTNTAVIHTSTPVPPTNTAAQAQPPASSGPILITDNDQTLTFTCNNNEVEVRGNANVITLLGACSSITVKGNGNRVYWQSGSPVITDTGNENVISQRS